MEIYNHLKERNLSISDDIDILQNKYMLDTNQNFRIDVNYNSLDGVIYGTTKINSFVFNHNYYFSNEFFGYLTSMEINGYFYGRLLTDIKKAYEITLSLSKKELLDN